MDRTYQAINTDAKLPKVMHPFSIPIQTSGTFGERAFIRVHSLPPFQHRAPQVAKISVFLHRSQAHCTLLTYQAPFISPSPLSRPPPCLRSTHTNKYDDDADAVPQFMYVCLTPLPCGAGAGVDGGARQARCNGERYANQSLSCCCSE